MLLKVVSHYDLSVPSMTVINVFPKNVWIRVYGLSSIQVFLGIFLTLQNPYYGTWVLLAV